MSEPGIPTRRPRHWLEYISTAFAVIISLISLWVAIETERANRQMVAASSWPMLQVDSSSVDAKGDSVLLFRVTNTGVGPAKVRSFELFYKGRPTTGAVQLIRACCQKDFARTPPDESDPKGFFITGGVPGNVIRAGEIHTFIQMGLGVKNLALWNALNKARNTDISYRVCYCSVFDECWLNTVTGRNQLDPKPVDRCPVPSVGYTE
ncbi:MAG TPA: hypothetical protein VGM36_03285 [Rhizomicrobium sp.]|jgi:hypothetical protein